MRQVVYSHINRNLFTQNSFLSNRAKMEALVFKAILVCCGMAGSFLPKEGLA
ncbi:MAG: hypothetical protein LBE81_13245 [Azonexus sp.]|jgi:hypothetical protein|uniref:hypothetical protein n=1 Tax=Azonexus sp. TaxID=1872668 RepID=UPI00282877F3|nr:hypothetical protein [Azonexus sp.]MDR0777582.1 hypothetical protein [Azonexus sp.]